MKAQLGIAAAGNVAAWIAQWNAIADPVCTWLKNQSRLPSYFFQMRAQLGIAAAGNIDQWIAQWNAIADPVCT